MSYYRWVVCLLLGMVFSGLAHAQWHYQNGKLAQDIAVGKNGAIYMVETNYNQNGGLVFKWDGNDWQEIGGLATRVDADYQGRAWIINSSGSVFQRNISDTGWDYIPGLLARDIGVGPDGAVYLIGKTTVAACGGLIYRWNGSVFQEIGGCATRVDVDNRGLPWVINDSGAVFRRNDANTGWDYISGMAARDIGVGADGTVFITGKSPVSGGGRIYRWNANAWQEIGGGAAHVSVDGSGRPVIINDGGAIFFGTAPAPLQWNYMAGATGRDISIGKDGAIYMLDQGPEVGGGRIYTWRNWSWQEVGGLGERIDAEAQGHVWIVNAYGSIFRRNATDSGWDYIPGQTARDVGVAPDGSVYIIGRDTVDPACGGRIYKWNGSAFIELGGCAVRIDADNRGLPWVVNAGGAVFRRNNANTAWDYVPGIAARDISVGADGTVFVASTEATGGGGLVYRWNGNAWQKNDTSAAQIAVNPKGEPAIINDSGAISFSAGVSLGTVQAGANTYDLDPIAALIQQQPIVSPIISPLRGAMLVNSDQFQLVLSNRNGNVDGIFNKNFLANNELTVPVLEMVKMFELWGLPKISDQIPFTLTLTSASDPNVAPNVSISFRVIDTWWNAPDIVPLIDSKLIFKTLDVILDMGNHPTTIAGAGTFFVKPTVQDPWLHLNASLRYDGPGQYTIGGITSGACLDNPPVPQTDPADRCTEPWNVLGLGLVNSTGGNVELSYIGSKLDAFSAKASGVQVVGTSGGYIDAEIKAKVAPIVNQPPGAFFKATVVGNINMSAAVFLRAAAGTLPGLQETLQTMPSMNLGDRSYFFATMGSIAAPIGNKIYHVPHVSMNVRAYDPNRADSNITVWGDFDAATGSSTLRPQDWFSNPAENTFTGQANLVFQMPSGYVPANTLKSKIDAAASAASLVLDTVGVPCVGTMLNVKDALGNINQDAISVRNATFSFAMDRFVELCNHDGECPITHRLGMRLGVSAFGQQFDADVQRGSGASIFNISLDALANQAGYVAVNALQNKVEGMINVPQALFSCASDIPGTVFNKLRDAGNFLKGLLGL